MEATISFTILNGVPDYTYSLYTIGNVFIESGTTSSYGIYYFYNVTNGDYYIVVTDSNGDLFVTPTINVNCVEPTTTTTTTTTTAEPTTTTTTTAEPTTTTTTVPPVTLQLTGAFFSNGISWTATFDNGTGVKTLSVTSPPANITESGTQPYLSNSIYVTIYKTSNGGAVEDIGTVEIQKNGSTVYTVPIDPIDPPYDISNALFYTVTGVLDGDIIEVFVSEG